jgi:hypothetical protein
MVALWAVVLAPLAAQETSLPAAIPPQLLLLSRAKQHMREVLLRQPNYTCQMSIERSRRRNPRRAFELVDQLRLEVALIDGKETFSWPGARKFDDRELRDMVGGTSSTGSYAGQARTLFLSTVPRFTYLGPRAEAGGRTLHAWRFDVAQLHSGYKLTVADKSGNMQEAVVGYHGEILIEEASLDLVKLSYTAEEIPPHLGIRSTADTISYERLKIGDLEYLLPVMSDLNITDLDGATSRNRTRFHNCRQYSGESLISFDEPPAEGAPAASPPQPIPPLPPGLTMEADLAEAIVHPITVGAPIEFILSRPARRKGVTYLPKQAIVHGRLIRGGALPGRVPVTFFTLQFEQIEVNGVFADAHLELSDVLPPQFGGVRQSKLAFEPGEPAPIPGHFTIGITGNRPELRKGLRVVLAVIPPGASHSARSAASK